MLCQSCGIDSKLSNMNKVNSNIDSKKPDQNNKSNNFNFSKKNFQRQQFKKQHSNTNINHAFLNSKWIKWILLAIIYALFATLFWPFKKTILLAVLMAFALIPVFKKINYFIKNEKLTIFLIVTCLMGVFIMPLTIIIIKGLKNFSKIQEQDFTHLPIYKNLEQFVFLVSEKINQLATDYQIDFINQIDIKGIIPSVGQYVITNLTDLASSIPLFLTQLIIFVFCLYFLLVHRYFFEKLLVQSRIFEKNSFDKLKQFLQNVCFTIVISTIVIASIQALIISSAAYIVGFSDFLIVFMMAFFLSFVPVIGSAPLSLSMATYLIIQSNTSGAVVLIVAATIAAVIDNVIKTYVLSQAEDSAHPFVSLLALIGSMSLFGVSGLFLGPIITQLAFSIRKII